MCEQRWKHEEHQGQSQYDTRYHAKIYNAICLSRCWFAEYITETWFSTILHHGHISVECWWSGKFRSYSFAYEMKAGQIISMSYLCCLPIWTRLSNSKHFWISRKKAANNKSVIPCSNLFLCATANLLQNLWMRPTVLWPLADTKLCFARLTLNILQIFFLGFNDLHIGL